jgi:hypothetical protein
MPEKGQISEGSITKFQSSLNEIDVKGRFTPNLLVCDDMLNDGITSKGFSGGGGPTRFAGAVGGKKLDEYNYYGDKGSSSRYYDLDKWFDKVIDEIQ